MKNMFSKNIVFLLTTNEEDISYFLSYTRYNHRNSKLDRILECIILKLNPFYSYNQLLIQYIGDNGVVSNLDLISILNSQGIVPISIKMYY